LLKASQFGFRSLHSMTLQCMRLTSMDTVLLDIEKAFDTTWHHRLLYKLPKLHFLASITKLIS